MGSDTLISLLLLFILLLQLLLLYRSVNDRHARRRIAERLQAEVQTLHRHQFNQFEAYHYLRDRLKLHDGIPHTTDWSAAPDFLKLIVDHCLHHKPKTIVECSSGTTTLMLARCCEMNGGGQVVSLENGGDYAEMSRGHLQRYGVASQATVLHAPLSPYEINGLRYEWYDIGALPDGSIDMLVIDGPPGFIQPHSRYPALPLLKDKLAEGCVIFMDDAARPDEKEIVDRWQALIPGLQHEYIKTERGCSVLTLP